MGRKQRGCARREKEIIIYVDGKLEIQLRERVKELIRTRPTTQILPSLFFALYGKRELA